MNWASFFKALAVAVGGAAVTVAGGSIQSGQTAEQTGMNAAVAAIVTALAYLAKSPIVNQPTDVKEESEKK